MDSEKEKSYHQVKTRTLYLTTKRNVKLKETILQLAFRWLLPLFCFQISSGRDGRASKSVRRQIERTRVVLPIPTALLLAQTNWLLVF